MLPTTILIDEAPRCVVRPTDTKDLNRFIRNGKIYLLAGSPDGKITHRNADDIEAATMAECIGAAQSLGRRRRRLFRSAALIGRAAGLCRVTDERCRCREDSPAGYASNQQAWQARHRFPVPR